MLFHWAGSSSRMPPAHQVLHFLLPDAVAGARTSGCILPRPLVQTGARSAPSGALYPSEIPTLLCAPQHAWCACSGWAACSACVQLTVPRPPPSYYLRLCSLQTHGPSPDGRVEPKSQFCPCILSLRVHGPDGPSDTAREGTPSARGLAQWSNGFRQSFGQVCSRAGLATALTFDFFGLTFVVLLPISLSLNIIIVLQLIMIIKTSLNFRTYLYLLVRRYAGWQDQGLHPEHNRAAVGVRSSQHRIPLGYN